jgi:hypothetical protein
MVYNENLSGRSILKNRSKVLTKDNPLPRTDHTFVNIKENGFLFGGFNCKRNLNDLGDLQELNLGILNVCFSKKLTKLKRKRRMETNFYSPTMAICKIWPLLHCV